MLGSVLIMGGDKKGRLKEAWALLAEHGLKPVTEGMPSPDFLVVRKEEAKKSIGIVQAREIKDFFRQRPFEKPVKAVLVEDAQSFTDDAQGSLLKILEEPPAFGLIILLVGKEGSLLPTVVSRCQKILVGRTQERKGSATKSPRSSHSSDSDLHKSLDKSPYNLLSYDYEQLFELAKSVSAKGKEEALDFLEQVLHWDTQNGTSLPVVKKMEKALKELKEANAALKFALEYLFLLHTHT